MALRREEPTLPRKSFSHTPEGHPAVGRYLVRQGRRGRGGRESPGVEGLDRARRLQQPAGREVRVANPRAGRPLAQALRERSKTDPLDAAVLREFAGRLPLQPWPPPWGTALPWCALARRRPSRTDRCPAEANRRPAAGASPALPVVIRQDLRRSSAFPERAGARLTRQALPLIARDPLWQERFQPLDRIPGIAAPRASALLAERSLLAAGRDVRQGVASASLDPRQYSSGTCVRRKTRLSKAGNRPWRRALYRPALLAVRHDLPLRACYQHLLGRGKSKRQAVVAVRRKLWHAIFGLFQQRQSYDGSQLFPVVLATPEAA